ncbi:hypothetical protein V8V91_03355 [Algoriphagus halophilus]|uniref:phage tail protein n=1 Tax=Algoriphagus halophilus TaxID=226505 RepID=UPI00358F3AB3
MNLTIQNLPNHNHTLNAENAAGTSASPTNNVPANAQVQLERGGEIYNVNSYGPTPNAIMVASSVGSTGGSIPVSVQNPYLGINYIICLYGIFPSRN